MPVYERETVVAAPLSTVWAFHARLEGLTAVTPDWLGLRVEHVEGPDGRGDDELVAGTRIRLSVRPFGLGPRQAWTSVIRESEERADEAILRDEMVAGPFPRWIHTHRFTAVDRSGVPVAVTESDSPAVATRVRDIVEYRLPGGRLGRAAEPLSIVGFEPVFAYRHWRTRRLLAGGDGCGRETRKRDAT